jgi:hypothetical protein
VGRVDSSEPPNTTGSSNNIEHHAKKKGRNSKQNVTVGNPTPNEATVTTTIMALPDTVLCDIFEHLTRPRDLAALQRTCKRFGIIVSKYNLWNRRELVCFFTKKTFLEETLGVGIHLVSGDKFYICEADKNVDKTSGWNIVEVSIMCIRSALT